MNRRLILPFVLLTILSCSGQKDAELREFVDPISNSISLFEQNEIGDWGFLTIPDQQNEFLLVTRNGKPIVAIDNTSAMIFENEKSALDVVRVTRQEMWGEYNRLMFFSTQPESKLHLFERESGKWKMVETN